MADRTITLLAEAGEGECVGTACTCHVHWGAGRQKAARRRETVVYADLANILDRD